MNHKNLYIGIVVIVIVLVSSIGIAGYYGIINLGTNGANGGNTDTTGGMNANGTYNVTFAQSGIDSSANGIVVAVTVGNDTQTQTFATLPYTIAVDPNTTVSYSYQANISTTVTGALFILSDTAYNGSSVVVNSQKVVNATYDRAVIDYVGNIIKIPAASAINRIADSWAAHNTIVVLAGAGDKLVATVPGDKIIAMFQRILPAIKDMAAPFDSSGNPNVEQLLAVSPDIVFVSSTNEKPAKAIENAGMLVVRLNFLNFPDMLKCVRLTGWILGEDALAKADAYVAYFNQAYNAVTTVTSQIPAEQKLSVYHVAGTSPLYCDGVGTLGDSWINACGGTNAVTISGNMKQVGIEDVLTWDPDVILIGSANATTIKADILGNSVWSGITAVKNSKVIVNPMGVFDWSRYSVEEALNIQWVAQTLYPDKFNFDMTAQTKYFYQTFYGYTLSDAEVTAILTNTALP